MPKFFITAKTTTTLLDLLTENLPKHHDAETVITCGGAWFGRKNRITDPRFRLKKNDTVQVYVNASQGLFYRIEKEHVVFEDEDLLALYKPGNLNVHAVPSSICYDLSYGVRCYLEQQGIATGPVPPTPATRLDRPVAGVVLFGKNKNSERLLFELVRNGKVKKWYIAALEKGGQTVRLRIHDTIASSGHKTALHPEGKSAATCFVKIDTLAQAEIYSVFPFTGRRHQIRFHASHYLTPVVGDIQYGSRNTFAPNEIALLCRGYNLPWKGKNLKIRLSESFLNAFYQRAAP
ncbi:MAG: RNA pseudouridine synthase [Candidatus Aminicenantes bacterium]|nr:RNA pseudouridine synthase [Candidatus Aminicenantes bacterium]